jgi:transcription antitermination factor NusG
MENGKNKYNPSEKNWFALYTRPRHEFKAAAQLKAGGIEFFLPSVTKVKQWSDRKKKIEEPVLRGYIFVFASEEDRVEALKLDPIIRCLFEHGRPAVIPEWQIDNLKNFLSKESDFFVHEGLIPGAKVTIKDGPFAGIVGTILTTGNEKSVSVTLDLLNRSIVAQLPADTSFELLKECPKYEKTKAYYYAPADEDESAQDDEEEPGDSKDNQINR